MRASRCGAVRTFQLLLAGATVGRCGLRCGVCFLRKPGAKRFFSRKHGEGFFRWVHLNCSHESHYKVSLQGIIIMKVNARSHCKESLQGVIARSHCKESLQGVIARSHGKDCSLHLQLALDSLHLQLDSMHLQLALDSMHLAPCTRLLALGSLHLQLALNSVHLRLALDSMHLAPCNLQWLS